MYYPSEEHIDKFQSFFDDPSNQLQNGYEDESEEDEEEQIYLEEMAEQYEMDWDEEWEYQESLNPEKDIPYDSPEFKEFVRFKTALILREIKMKYKNLPSSLRVKLSGLDDLQDENLSYL